MYFVTLAFDVSQYKIQMMMETKKREEKIKYANGKYIYIFRVNIKREYTHTHTIRNRKKITHEKKVAKYYTQSLIIYMCNIK